MAAPFRRRSDAQESRRTPPRPAVAVVSPEVGGPGGARPRVVAAVAPRVAPSESWGVRRRASPRLAVAVVPPEILVARRVGVAAASPWLVRGGGERGGVPLALLRSGGDGGCERDGWSSRPSCGVVAAARRVGIAALSSQLIRSGERDGASPPGAHVAQR